MTHEQPNEPEPGSPEQGASPRPSIWVGSLLDYNNGRLNGEWLDATLEVDELRRGIDAVLTSSPTTATTGEPAEEWAILDSDEFGAFDVGEHEDLETVARVARGIRDHGDAFAAWADLQGGDNDLLSQFEDCYFGQYESPQDWADQFLADTGATAELEQLATERLGDIARYVRIDTDAWAHDAWLSGDISITQRPGGGVWIFANR